jgi:hypothetical protein
MMPLPLLLETRKALICHGGQISSCKCGVPKEVNEITSKYTANENQVFFPPLFYADPV